MVLGISIFKHIKVIQGNPHNDVPQEVQGK